MRRVQPRERQRDGRSGEWSEIGPDSVENLASTSLLYASVSMRTVLPIRSEPYKPGMGQAVRCSSTSFPDQITTRSTSSRLISSRRRPWGCIVQVEARFAMVRAYWSVPPFLR